MPDTGAPDPALATALAGDLTSRTGRAALLAALVDARVFATITATATAEHVEQGTGLRAESSAEMAVVLLEAKDGSRALPVFSGLLSLRAWRADARPVVLSGAEACAAALEQGAAAVVLDPGSRDVALAPDEVRSLARGWVPVPGSPLAARRTTSGFGEPAEVPDRLLASLRRAVRPEGLRAARLLAGPDGPVLGVTPARPTDPAALAALAARVRERLGADLPSDGLDLAVVPVDGPGRDLLGRGWLRRRGR